MENVKVKGVTLVLNSFQGRKKDHWLNEVKDLGDGGIDFYVGLEIAKKMDRCGIGISESGANFSKKKRKKVKFTGELR